ncbi:D-alanyl-D-alanine carboxypeptidase [hydrothermal vent metagenome]|uniref:D-alanyl-D-alanine carboxypeptidase n=1 Tax=hydrothermal vent metagenome TaxID=652676 RepID=A0A3B0VX00_9ZZZZ
MDRKKLRPQAKNWTKPLTQRQAEDNNDKSRKHVTSEKHILFFMEKCRVTVLIKVLIFCLILLPLGSAVHAARIRIIDTTAKHAPTRAPAALLRNSAPAGSYLTLGKNSDISIIKTRPEASHFSATRRLLKVSKEITSRSAIIVDAGTGRAIFAKSADTPRQPASTIKILTGLIAIKSLRNNEQVKVSRHAARMPRSKVYLDRGKSYRAGDLINAVLLSSANDASVALAEKIAGSEAEFTKMMNLRAQLWGAKDTVCRSATGLTRRGQHTTARDLATIFRHAVRDKEFVRRMGTVKIRTSFGELLRNHNRALWRVKGAVAGKTGYTAAARQTYVGLFTRGDESIIVAIMGSETMWSDIKDLVEYGFKQEKREQLAEQGPSGRKSKIAMLN